MSDISHRTIVITGASSGIGAAAARKLQESGHRLVLVGRNKDKTHAIAQDLGAQAYIADFARLQDVRKLASDLLTDYPHIDVLANNAGAMSDSFDVTVDGFESSFQVNHLAPYLLTRMLAGVLTASRASVIWTSSIAIRHAGELQPQRLGAVDSLARQEFTPLRAYGQSKLAMTIVMAEFQRRFGAASMANVAFHPGVVSSSFGDDLSGLVGWYFRSALGKALMTPPDKAASRLVRLVEGTPGRDWTPGTFVVGKGPSHASQRQLADLALGKAVWQHTEDLLDSLVE